MPADRRIAIVVDGISREILLHLPDPPKRDIPLVVMLHGKGGSAAWAEEETGWSRLADREGFAVAYPEALPRDRSSPPKFLTNPALWHDGSFLDDAFAERADLHFLSTMLDVLTDKAAIDPARIFATGFSNGAGMAFALANRFADRIAAIAPVAGHCWLDEPAPVRPVPTFFLIGSDDPLIPLAGGRVRSPWGKVLDKPSVEGSLRKWARAIGCSETPTLKSRDADSTLQSFSAADDHYRCLLLTIAQLGHHWPGGLGRLSHKIAGRPSEKVDACERIWGFFQQRRLG